MPWHAKKILFSEVQGCARVCVQGMERPQSCCLSSKMGCR